MAISAAAYRQTCNAQLVDAVGLLQLMSSPTLLKDLLRLRNTCKCCDAEKRFPISGGRALEVGLVEQYFGGELSIFVSTADIRTVLKKYIS